MLSPSLHGSRNSEPEIGKRLRSPGIDSKEMISPAYSMLPGGLVRQPYVGDDYIS